MAYHAESQPNFICSFTNVEHTFEEDIRLESWPICESRLSMITLVNFTIFQINKEELSHITPKFELVTFCNKSFQDLLHFSKCQCKLVVSKYNQQLI